MHRSRFPHCVVLATLATLFVPPTRALDDNGDGRSDVWVRQFNASALAVSADTDGDGFTNAHELAFGTNPRLNGAPNLYTDTFGMPTPGLHLGFAAATWRTVKGVRYNLEATADLLTWTLVSEAIVGSGGLQNVYLDGATPALAPRVFFRLNALPPLDADGDGLDAMEEGLLNTSDLSLDTDGDTLSDVLEFRLGYNPASGISADTDPIPDDWEVYYFGNIFYSGDDDPDDDGLTNLDEFANGTNPTVNEFAQGAFTHAFTYDDEDRLTDVVSALTEGLAVDEEGNLTSK